MRANVAIVGFVSIWFEGASIPLFLKLNLLSLFTLVLEKFLPMKRLVPIELFIDTAVSLYLSVIGLWPKCAIAYLLLLKLVT